MFVRYYLELPMVFSDVEAVLLRSPETLLTELVQGAHARGELLLADAGVAVDDRRRSRPVAVVFGEPVRFGSKTTLPMSWQVNHRQAPFPSMEADIEIAPLGRDATQLAISARYGPPVRPPDRALDRSLLHRVAEATIKDFLDRVGRAVVEDRAA